MFVTCLADALRPRVGVAAAKLLRGAGAEVVYPPAQTCCGQIAYNSGYAKDARLLAKKCAAEFADCDAVVIPSGSCCGMFRAELPELFRDSADDNEKAEIETFRQKCMELGEYLESVNFVPAEHFGNGGKKMRVTFHDSCTGLRELGIKDAPRRLLRAAGADIVEMPDCEECCGFGGRFAESFGELSAELAERKCKNALSVQADAVVGGDVGCLLNIEGRLRRRGDNLPVLHWAEVVAGEAA